MEIRKTQPGSSRFVESRSAKSNSGELVGTAMRGLQREAQAVGDFVGAAGNLANAVMRGGQTMSAVKEREAVREADRTEDDLQIRRRAAEIDLAYERGKTLEAMREKKKRKQADLATDMKLYAIQAESEIADLLNKETGGIDFLEQDESRFNESVGGLLSKIDASVKTDLDARGTIRDRDEDSDRKTLALRQAILEGARSDLTKRRINAIRNDALGRANVVAEALSESGSEDPEQYASCYADLERYGFSKDEIRKFTEISLKKGMSVAFGKTLSYSLNEASNAFQTSFAENVENSMSTKAAAKSAYESARRILAAPFWNEGKKSLTDYYSKLAETFVNVSGFEKAIANAEAQLARMRDSVKEATNAQIASDLKDFMSGSSDSMKYPETYRFLRYYNFQGTAQSDDALTKERISKIFTEGESDLPEKARNLSAQDADDFTTYAQNDLALLDLGTESGRRQAEKILKYSLLLPESNRATILYAFRQSVLEIGEPKRTASKKRIEDAVSTAKSRLGLSKDEANQLSGYLLETSRLHGDINMEAYIPAAVEEWRKRSAAQKAYGSMAAMLFGTSEDNLNTGIDFLKQTIELNQ